MASQEHLAMLNIAEGDDDDEEDDSSSTTTNSSTSTSTSDDDDDSDDDETSSEDEELVRSLATPAATNGASAMDVSSPVLGGSVKSEGSLSPSMPSKKRIKLGIRLKTTKTENANDVDQPRSKEQSEIEGSTLGALSAKLSSGTAKPLIVQSSSQVPEPVASRAVKKNIKLPPHKAMMERVSTEGTDGDGDLVVKAMVVESDDGGDDDAVVAVVERLVPEKSKSSSRTDSTSATSGGTKQQRRQANPTIKPVRFPPISSPGLLTTVPAGQYRETIDASTGLATPAAVFDHAMSLVGYTFETRSKKPHRGSSVRRVVDDMFDSNVKFTLNFPRLIPEDLLNAESEATPETSNNGATRLTDRLLNAFKPTKVHTNAVSSESDDTQTQPVNGQVTGMEKRRKRKLPGFKEMAPLSLTIPYPEEYIQKRLEYVKRVNEREQAIVDYQEQELLLDKEKEQLEMAGKPVPENFTKPMVVIPPIPEPPSPPRLGALDGFEPDAFEDMHPFYLPKTGDQTMVAHLDKGCFHIVDGRYFGLYSNYIADPNFVGPNAPGLSGLSLSGGTGLATANTGGGGASGGTLLSAPSQSGASVNANPNPKTKEVAAIKELGKTKSPAKPKDVKTVNKSKASTAPPKTTPNKTSKNATASTATTTSPPKKKSNGPAATASASDLRKIIEDGGDEAEKLKTCIIRAAVYASRCGKHTRNFRAPDGNVYPDISKAFALHAGLKSCERCKNNKQGAYHCRLRRKHKELDHDGTDSPAVLAPLFKVPMEDLVIRVIKQKPGDGAAVPAVKESSAGIMSPASG